jgi:hypothetical protein
MRGEYLTHAPGDQRNRLHEPIPITYVEYCPLSEGLERLRLAWKIAQPHRHDYPEASTSYQACRQWEWGE